MSDFSNLENLAKVANAVTGDVRVEMTIASDAGPNQEEIDAVTAFMGAATPAAVLELIAESKRLEKKLDHNDYYCATRFETLFHWAHRELNDSQKNQYFSIVANGSSYPDDPPTYAQQMNQLKWKVEAAEKERDMLKVELDRLRTAEGDAMTYKAGMENVAQQRDQFRAESAGLRGQVDTLTEWYANALNEIEALRKDAERYRFLRNDLTQGGDIDFCIVRKHWKAPALESILSLTNADEQIDAAMTK